jgi:Uma2 family endonuclease
MLARKARRNVRFINGPPAFAVEVRSENDCTPSAEAAILAKRADYFLAGTRVVWDVDPVGERIVKHRPESPDEPVVYAHGEFADCDQHCQN